MTKIKRNVLISVISIFLVCGLLFIFVWGAPWGRHSAKNKEPIETDQLFSLPDSIAYIHRGISQTLSEEQRSQVYELFVQLFTVENDVSISKYFGEREKNEFLKDIFKNISLEFRYEQRRKFVGSFKGTTADPMYADFEISGPFEYDAILISCSERDTLTIVLYKNRQYQFRGQYWFLGTPTQAFEIFEKKIEEIV